MEVCVKSKILDLLLGALMIGAVLAVLLGMLLCSVGRCLAQDLKIPGMEFVQAAQTDDGAEYQLYTSRRCYKRAVTLEGRYRGGYFADLFIQRETCDPYPARVSPQSKAPTNGSFSVRFDKTKAKKGYKILVIIARGRLTGRIK